MRIDFWERSRSFSWPAFSAISLAAVIFSYDVAQSGQVSVLPPPAIVSPTPRPSPPSGGVTGTPAPSASTSLSVSSPIPSQTPFSDSVGSVSSVTPRSSEMQSSAISMSEVSSFDISVLSLDQMNMALTIMEDLLQSNSLSSDERAFIQREADRLAAEMALRTD